ncbi:MAG: DNA internalization-related competence protein ComEC/Rec2 [Clostridia bacterium]|nr:DNA internalization-related competence protein ComEC/Rec2 [Clostridia bacterium]
MKRPLVIVAVGIIIGILWELYFSKSVLLLLCMVGIAKFALLLIKKYRRYIEFFLPFKIFFIFIIGVVIGSFSLNSEKNVIETIEKNKWDTEINATVISDVKTGDYKDTYIVQIEDENFRNVHFLLNIKKQDIKYKYGDLLQIRGEYKKPTGKRNFGGYNYYNYLLSTNIKGIIEDVQNVEVLRQENLDKFSLTVNKFTSNIKQRIKTFLKGDNAELFISLILADKTNLNDEIQENFKQSNLSHILAVSGMHVAYIITIMTFILNQVIHKRYLKIILVFILVIYMQMTNYIPSVVRAGIMSIVSLIAGIILKRDDIKNNIAVSMIIILLYNPYCIRNLGLQLSYIGVISIMMYQGLMGKFLKQCFRVEKIKNKTLVKITKYISSTIQVTLAANILILPILLYNFNSIPINFLISNILVTPIIAFIIGFGIITIIISFFFPQMAIICGKLLNFSINIINIITENISKIENKIIITPLIVSILLYYIAVLTFWSFLVLKNKKRKYTIEENFLSSFIKLVCWLKKKGIAIILIIIIPLGMVLNNIPKTFKVYFVDVGQGDCTLIQTSMDKKILIDGGGSEFSNYDVGEKILVPYLLDRRVKKIDFVMISHFDSDHVQGIFKVMENFEVGKILISKQPESSENFERFLEIANKEKIEIIQVNKGDKVLIDKDTYFKILWPDKNNFIEENPLNNNSIVAKLIHLNFSMLFTGDIEEIAEKQLLKYYDKELKSTVLKVAHHGSKTSSTHDFLVKVNPEVAVIGVGEKNTFGHPNDVVLQRLIDMNVEIHRTDKMGEGTIDRIV